MGTCTLFLCYSQTHSSYVTITSLWGLPFSASSSSSKYCNLLAKSFSSERASLVITASLLSLRGMGNSEHQL